MKKVMMLAAAALLLGGCGEKKVFFVSQDGKALQKGASVVWYDSYVGRVRALEDVADGTKVSAKSQLLVGERECALAVSWTKKSSSVACLVWFREDGTVECGNLPGGASALIANLRAGATLAPGTAFRIDPAAVAAKVSRLQAELLPDGLAVRMKGTSFVR